MKCFGHKYDENCKRYSLQYLIFSNIAYILHIQSFVFSMVSCINSEYFRNPILRKISDIRFPHINRQTKKMVRFALCSPPKQNGGKTNELGSSYYKL